MSLGAAEQLSTATRTPPALLAEAAGGLVEALAELRDLVRGIHPPVLADRGLGRRGPRAGPGQPAATSR